MALDEFPVLLPDGHAGEIVFLKLDQAPRMDRRELDFKGVFDRFEIGLDELPGGQVAFVGNIDAKRNDVAPFAAGGAARV